MNLSDVKYEIGDGQAVIWGYTGPGGDVTIPASIEGHPVTVIGIRTFENCGTITSVLIPEGMRVIGAMAFKGCSRLASVTIPASVIEIGDMAFAGCTGLGDGVVVRDGCVLAVNGECPDRVELPQGTRLIAGGVFSNRWQLVSVTIPPSVIAIGDWAFSHCHRLSSMTIPEGVATIGEGAFYHCERFAAVEIPGSVRTIGKRAFAQCNELTSITIPKGVTTIADSSFSGCGKLRTVTIPEGVTGIGDCAFEDCRSLECVTIPEGVTSIGWWAFTRCEWLTSVKLPQSLVHMGNEAFVTCRGLVVEDIPPETRALNATAFRGCGAPKVVVKPDNESDGLNGLELMHDLWGVPVILSIPASSGSQYLPWTFGSYSWLEEILADPDHPDVKSVEGVLYTKDGEGLVRCPAGIRRRAFTVPEGVKWISSYAFRDCRNLRRIEIPEGVESIGECVFSNCYNLAEIKLPESLEIVGMWDFEGCTSLTHITIPAGVKRILGGAFDDCPNLTAIDVEAGNENYKSVGGVLYAKDGRTLIKCPQGLPADTFVIPEEVTMIGEGAFAGCLELRNVKFLCRSVSCDFASAFADTPYWQNLKDGPILSESGDVLGYKGDGCRGTPKLR